MVMLLLAIILSLRYSTITIYRHNPPTLPREGRGKELVYNFTSNNSRRSKFDHLDKAFCILKLPKDVCMKADDGIATDVAILEEYVYRRVDFIVVPLQQYPFALVSWTGSKVLVWTRDFV